MRARLFNAQRFLFDIAAEVARKLDELSHGHLYRPS
jgi:hypothetical protein